VVVKASRWTSYLLLGAITGAAVVFLGLVGMVEVFARKAIIVGVISLGHTLLLLTGLVAGLQAAARAGRRPGPALGAALLAGVTTGAVVCAFIVAGTSANLRGMFVNASPALFGLLSFGRGSAGFPLVVLAWTVGSLLGGTFALLPPAIRRPLSAGGGAILLLGLFQELLQLLLQEGTIRPLVRAFLFDNDGLIVRGAVTGFAVAVVWSAVRQRWRPSVRTRFLHLTPRNRRVSFYLALLLTVVVLFYLPIFFGEFVSQVLVFVGLFTLMGLGLNLEVGFAGLLDLGFVAFFAIGAYTVALLTTPEKYALAHLSFWAAVPVAVLVSLIAGIFFGLPILGIRGDYLAIATLGFGEIMRLLVLSDFLKPWLGGARGIVNLPKPVLFGFEFKQFGQLFWITLAASALIAFVAARLRDSRLGRSWMAIREDEDVAEAMGINTIKAKLLAYGLGGAFAGMGGAIFAVMIGSVFPQSFSLLVSINTLALIIVGGVGSLPGVIVGSLFLVGLPELLREFSEFRFLVYGAVLILMMQVRPEGLWPAAAVARELRPEEAPAPAREEALATGGEGGG
jgi:branched-chain amino acid transport system permease protein